MKTKLFLVSFSIIILCFVNRVHAMQYQINVHGVPVSCTASNGQLVPIFTDFQSALAAKQLGGARADLTPYGYRISLDLPFMNSLSPLAAFFVMYHECAHVALPMGVGLASPAQERNADCHAIQSMQLHGLIKNYQDFQEAMTAVIKVGGAHAFSQQRINQISACMLPVTDHVANMPLGSNDFYDPLLPPEIYDDLNLDESEYWRPEEHADNFFIVEPK